MSRDFTLRFVGPCVTMLLLASYLKRAKFGFTTGSIRFKIRLRRCPKDQSDDPRWHEGWDFYAPRGVYNAKVFRNEARRAPKLKHSALLWSGGNQMKSYEANVSKDERPDI